MGFGDWPQGPPGCQGHAGVQSRLSQVGLSSHTASLLTGPTLSLAGADAVPSLYPVPYLL